MNYFLKDLQDWTRESSLVDLKVDFQVCLELGAGWRGEKLVGHFRQKLIGPRLRESGIVRLKMSSHSQIFNFNFKMTANLDIYMLRWLFHLAFAKIREKFIGLKLSLSGMILYLLHLVNISYSLTVLGKENPVPNWTLKYSLKHCSQVRNEASQ